MRDGVGPRSCGAPSAWLKQLNSDGDIDIDLEVSGLRRSREGVLERLRAVRGTRGSRGVYAEPTPG